MNSACKEDSTDIETDAVKVATREPSSGGFSPVVTDEGKPSENLSTSLQPAKPVSKSCDDHVSYIHFMEPYLKEENFDILIINSKDDQQEALNFKKYIGKDIIVEVNQVKYCPRVKLLNEIIDITSMSNLELAFSKTTYVFLFVTKQFCNDTWVLLQSQACLFESIREKKWSIIPVHTKSKKQMDYRLPMVLGSLQAINYWFQDDLCIGAIRNLFESNVGMRILRDAKLRNERQQFYESMEEEWKKYPECGKMPVSNTTHGDNSPRNQVQRGATNNCPAVPPDSSGGTIGRGNFVKNTDLIGNINIETVANLTINVVPDVTIGGNENCPVNQQPSSAVTPSHASTDPSLAMAFGELPNQCTESSAVAENTRDDVEQTCVKQPY